jgi:hypothetical protein
MSEQSTTLDLHSLRWIPPHPLVKHRTGVEYALSHDSRFVFERFRDASGRYYYRRAEWSRIAPNMQWADVPSELWTPVNETGAEVDPQQLEQTNGEATDPRTVRSVGLR